MYSEKDVGDGHKVVSVIRSGEVVIEVTSVNSKDKEVDLNSISRDIAILVTAVRAYLKMKKGVNGNSVRSVPTWLLMGVYERVEGFLDTFSRSAVGVF